MKIVPHYDVPVPASANVILTVAEVKEYCYADAVGTEDDSLFESLELGARNLCEEFLGRPLLTSTAVFWYNYAKVVELNQCSKRVLELPLGKLQSIGAINTYKIDTTEVVVDTDNYETSVTSNQFASVYFSEDILVNNDDPRVLDTMKITVTAGFGDTTTSVPDTIKIGMKALCAYWYEYRENQESIPSNVKALWSPYVIKRFK